MKHNIAVIDLFAGPGGLGEGFSKAGFKVILSIEKDPVACETLKLRHFYHQFTKSVPNIYYDVIKGYKNTIVIKKQ
ncbi:MAG: cytosine methyltransferase, partial [Pelagibacterales bacterium]|nr:cytosine methyltransferase [Pelagibacterales bacterium]